MVIIPLIRPKVCIGIGRNLNVLKWKVYVIYVVERK